MKKKIALISSSVLVLLLIAMAIFAPWLAPNDPYATNMALKLQGFSTDYPLGTDYLGRCVLSRLLYGARVSLFIALSVLVVTLFISMFVGLLAGYVGGIIDLVLMRLCDIFLAIPDFVFALVIVGALGGGIRNMFIAIVLVSWVGFARIIRNMVRSLKRKYVCTVCTYNRSSKMENYDKTYYTFCIPTNFFIEINWSWLNDFTYF
ncbi:Nickel ABC transporter permease subunit NikC OS=Lysinibacillus sphaericus OX=1421 GN=nikC PE=3 SV=1 [Lysinibacillus sphaericus]